MSARMLSVVCGTGVAAGAALGQAGGGTLEWATIGAAGNKPLDRLDAGWLADTLGRGGVGYEYRMGRTEITTGQWVEFLNSVNGLREDGSQFFTPYGWGAEIDPGYSGPGRRYRLRTDRGDDAALIPVAGIEWRSAARYCNWLHNGKQSDPASLASGAYDTSTFGEEINGWSFTDQHTRSEGAKYWIPSLDEWLKAAYYDPQRVNEDGSLGGWWTQPNGSDDPLTYGLPGEAGAESSAGLGLDPFDEFLPVGQYEAMGPWGLYDVSGGVGEWTEEVHSLLATNAERIYLGSSSSSGIQGAWVNDHIWSYGASVPSGNTWVGFRIASAVPSPNGFGLICLGLLVPTQRRRYT